MGVRADPCKLEPEQSMFNTGGVVSGMEIPRTESQSVASEWSAVQVGAISWSWLGGVFLCALLAGQTNWQANLIPAHTLC